MAPDEDDFELRSYGRRRGRKPSPRQDALLRDLLPRVSVELATPHAASRLAFALKAGVKSSTRSGQPTAADVHATPSTPCGQFPAGQSQGEMPVVLAAGSAQESRQGHHTWLEIGFGGGEHLIWQARENPNVQLIGCEPFEDGVIKVLTAIEAEGLGNIRLHMGDARDVLRALPDASIARAFILFPDPWPKRKHQKRRLINAHLLGMLARVMTPGGELRFATDIGDYARSALLAFRTEPRFCWQAASPQDWRIRPADWPPTRYEAKAGREGRLRYYFRFRRT
jgi:tRNA (guanine-N7-)-methyltransferase